MKLLQLYELIGVKSKLGSAIDKLFGKPNCWLKIIKRAPIVCVSLAIFVVACIFDVQGYFSMVNFFVISSILVPELSR